MCIICYEEEYGSPRVINENVLRAADLAKDINPFGHFHIVVEDFNLEDDNVDFCLKLSTDDNELAFGRLFRSLSIDERATALALADGFIDR